MAAIVDMPGATIETVDLAALQLLAAQIECPTEMLVRHAINNGMSGLTTAIGVNTGGYLATLDAAL